MFQSARLKLTAWYLLIIMCVSIFFSVIIYRFLDTELQRFALMQRYKIERRLREGMPIPSDLRLQYPTQPDPQLIADVENRIIMILILINGFILIASGGVGYFLAGRTLKPIKDMLDEQNRFIADASHEFRTPLTALKSNIEVTLTDKKLTILEAKDVLKESLGDVNQLQKLSDALLQLAQFQSKNGNRFQIVSIKSIMEKSVRQLYQQAKQKQIIIENQIAEKHIEANKERLSELFIILLDNAIKYSPEESTIFLESNHTENHARIYIKDEGVGIHEKDIPHIFDRFYRADKSRCKNEIAGYGLGLSIAKKIIESHNGSISVKSKINKGTVFTVQIPVKQRSR